MFTITICEDKPCDVACLQELLLQYGKLHNCQFKVNIYYDGESLLEAELQQPEGNIFLLDAILPGLDGIKVARKLRSGNRQEPILYLTASKNYAVEAFSVEAVNYLLKPICADTLFPALDTVLSRLKPPQMELFFSIQTNIGEVKVLSGNIVYVEQKRHFLYFHMADGTMISSKCLRIPFETALSGLIAQNGFLRPHQSYLINALHVTKLASHEVLMDGQTVIPISRLRWPQFRTQYMDYLFENREKE